MKLYTIGYGGRNPEGLVKVLKEESVPNWTILELF